MRHMIRWCALAVLCAAASLHCGGARAATTLLRDDASPPVAAVAAAAPPLLGTLANYLSARAALTSRDAQRRFSATTTAQLTAAEWAMDARLSALRSAEFHTSSDGVLALGEMQFADARPAIEVRRVVRVLARAARKRSELKRVRLRPIS